jgi:hypothetical protein
MSNLETARQAAASMSWEMEGAHIVGVSDGHSPREVVIQLRAGRPHNPAGWTAWLRSGAARGSCNFVAYGDTIPEALAAARRLFKGRVG